jgi:hypothetical protein
MVEVLWKREIMEGWTKLGCNTCIPSIPLYNYHIVIKTFRKAVIAVADEGMKKKFFNCVCSERTSRNII